MEAQPKGPQFIVGDFNDDISNMNPLKNLLKGGWTDMGAEAELWCQKACDYSCITANSKKP